MSKLRQKPSYFLIDRGEFHASYTAKEIKDACGIRNHTTFLRKAEKFGLKVFEHYNYIGKGNVRYSKQSAKDFVQWCKKSDEEKEDQQATINEVASRQLKTESALPKIRHSINTLRNEKITLTDLQNHLKQPLDDIHARLNQQDTRLTDLLAAVEEIVDKVEHRLDILEEKINNIT